jgi:hypothetical protein
VADPVEPYYVAAAPAVEPAPVPFAPPAAPEAAPIVDEASAVKSAPAPSARPIVKAAQDVTRLVAHKRPASLPVRGGRSTAVVQLGAYGSPQRVAAAWNAAARRHAVLRNHAPMSAAFSSPAGTVYRLSVRGFGSAREAGQLCTSLRRAGASCFVRGVAGDLPVRIASR